MGVIIAPSLQIYDKSIWVRVSELCLAWSKQNTSVSYYYLFYFKSQFWLFISLQVTEMSCFTCKEGKKKNTNIYFNACLNGQNAK